MLTTACAKDILVGADPASDATTAEDAGIEGGLAPLVVPWSTGFENGFDDWSQPSNGGLCYVAPPMAGAATYAIVTTPVHSGQYAAAFTVNTTVATPSQTRCYRQGVLPTSAYYGAWYYVPAAPTTNEGTWNLFHFQGADSPDAAVEELWDVSLVNQPDGAVAPSVYDFIRARQLAAGPPIPIAAWFHVEVRLDRSASNTGEFAVYVDGNPVLDLTGLATDDTSWGQWFVGNYATVLLPAPSIVYVDDVSIQTSGP
jgi:hypothetical protein